MKKVYSLVIGRFMPPHTGHIFLIRKILGEGKNVCIALRDTERSEENPYSLKQRRRKFSLIFQKEIEDRRVKIVVIPNIDEVVYGRKVGYKIREVRLPPDVEAISGTKIRNGQ